MGFFRMVPGLSSLRQCPPSVVQLLLKPSRVNWSLKQVQWRSFSTGGLCQMDKRTCGIPRIGSRLVRPRYRSSHRRAHYEDPPTFWSEHLNPENIVVGSIIATCAGVFVWHGTLRYEATTKYSREARAKLAKFYENFLMSARSLDTGRYHTILTSAFMHAGFLHFGLNMWVLWNFGRTAVWRMGIPSFVVLYLGSAIAGGVSQILFWRRTKVPQVEHNGVGASGAISGLIGALTCAMPLAEVSFIIIPMPLYAASAIGAAVSIAGMQGMLLPGIAHADHLGGMAFGVLWWLVAIRRGAPLRRLFRPR
ncbi:rhomboid-domain-containing protein [Diplocarpon rosae]|nr:rhomboid-domain-containing protein [Diplocarpon rosae]